MADEFTWSPSYGSGGTTTAAVHSTQYGDGYSQRTAAGINNLSGQFPVQFNNRSVDELNAIDQFLSNQGGYQWFWWTPQGRSAIKVTCSSWTFSWRGLNKTGLSATFVRVFDP
jgi:phage-related protein